MATRTVANIQDRLEDKIVDVANSKELCKREKAVKFKELCFWIIDLLYSESHYRQIKVGLQCFVSALYLSLLQSKRIPKLNLKPQSIPTRLFSYLVIKYGHSTRNLTSLDINRIILIPEKISIKSYLRNHQWISLVSPSLNNPNSKLERNFFCQIIIVEDLIIEKFAKYPNNKESSSPNHTDIFMTPTALYNLTADFPFPKKIKRIANIQSMYKVHLPLFKSMIKVSKNLRCDFGMIVKKAKTVKLSRLSSPYNANYSVSNSSSNSTKLNSLDRMLRKYFEGKKYVCMGDVIPITLKKGFERRTPTLDDENDFIIYLQVTTIEVEDEGNGNGNLVPGDEIDTNTFIYTISVNTTSLYVNENEIINSSHPVVDKRAVFRSWSFDSTSADKDIDILSICALPLEHYVNSFSQWLECFVELRATFKRQTDPKAEDLASELWPSALITGIVGSGKYTISKAFAEKHGLNFYCINMVHLIGDTSSFTIAKLTAVINKVAAYSPCILFIKNIHLLGRDKEGQEDKRVVLSFTDFLRDINKKSYGSDSSSRDEGTLSQQIFIIGSTHETEKIAPMVHDCFIHTANIEPFRKNDEVVEALEYLLKVHIRSELENSSKEVGSSFFIRSHPELFLFKNFNLREWAENKNAKTVIKYWGDVKALLSITVRKAITSDIVTSSKSNVEENVEDKSGSTAPPLCMTYALNRSRGNIILQHSHFTDALESLAVEIRSSVGSPKIPQVSWDDIGGLSSIKSELINSVQLPLKFPHLFTSGLKRSGILLYGPPGTGKTLVAKAVASEFKINFLSVKGPELLNMYVGQSEQNVREVFEKARDCAPCVLFFDELDSLAPNRGRSGDSGGVMDRVVSQILAEMDGTHSTPGVFIVGATNRPDLIDPALLRPGRFDKLMYVGVCEEKEGIYSILKAQTRKFNLSEDVNLEELAEKLPLGMSGADIYSLCSDSYMNALTRRIEILEKGESADQESPVQVSQHDFYQAVERVSVSLSKAEKSKYEDMKGLMR